MGVTEIAASLGDNPYFGAGAGLFGVGFAAAVARKASIMATHLFRRHYMTTVEVTCKDKSYPWLLHWIGTRGARKTQHLSVDTSFIESDSGKIHTRYEFRPSVGTHFMFFGRTWIKVERTREQRLMEPWETVQLTTLGNQKALFTRILDEAREMAMKQHSGKTVMYTVIGTDWRPFGHPRTRRPISSVVLDGTIANDVLADVKDFITSSGWYRQRGIPYRRGYLLHGPPGCGKTSFIVALAGELEYSICVLNLSDRSLSDDRLQARLADAPENSIILLEDVDAAFVSRETSPQIEAAYQGLNRLTFSGLLNAIDGAASAEGRIVFMTTNYVDRLDSALVRPGRIDFKQYIGFCSKGQLQEMFGNFYPNCLAGDATKFASSLEGVEVSPAAVQGHFMFYKHSAKDALENSFRLLPASNKSS